MFVSLDDVVVSDDETDGLREGNSAQFIHLRQGIIGDMTSGDIVKTIIKLEK